MGDELKDSLGGREKGNGRMRERVKDKRERERGAEKERKEGRRESGKEMGNGEDMGRIERVYHRE